MRYLLIVFVLFLSACDDGATVRHYDKNLQKLSCLRLSIFPPDKLLSETLQSLYSFTPTCIYTLQASRKGGIVCNSNQNAPKKALSNFPSAFVRLDIYEGKKPLYSYYKDLSSPADKSDIRSGFLRLKEDTL